MATGSTGFLPQIDYTARDFATIRASLIKHVQNFFPNDWQDFTESNLGMCILELVAYVGDQLSFYLDRVVNELFLPTVVQRANAINLVSLLGYTPRSVAAASTPIQMRLDVAQTGIVTVPAFTTFQDEGGETWEFLENTEIPIGRTLTTSIQVTGEIMGTSSGGTTYSLKTVNSGIIVGSATIHVTVASIVFNITVADDGSIFLPFGGSGILDYNVGSLTLNFVASHEADVGTDITIDYQWNQPITAYHGRTRLEQFISDGTSNQEVTLTNVPVLFSPLVEDDPPSVNPNRFEVWFGDPGDPFGDGTGTLWRRVESLVSASGTEEVYSLSLDDQDRVKITFGDNVNGKVPPAGTLNIIYRTGGGVKGNIATGFITTSVTGLVGLFATTVFLTNYEPGSGGAERESLDEIRVNAPAFFRTNDTATTEQDYDTLSLFSRSGLGAIIRAKSRLTPQETVVTKTIHSSQVLGTVPVSEPLEYYLLMPAVPVIVDTVSVSYTVAGILRTVTSSIVAGDLADLHGDATIDAGNTRYRTDKQDVEEESPTGLTGDGTTVDFSAVSPNGLVYFPIMPESIVFRYTIGGTDFVGYDDGAGNLVGVHIEEGTVDYNDGSIELHFGTHATLISQNSETFNFDGIATGNDVWLRIKIDSGGFTNIRFQPGDAVDYTAVTAAEVVTVLNTGGVTGGGNALVGATASVVTSPNRVKIISNTHGVTSKLDVDVASGIPGGDGDANDTTNGLKFSLIQVVGISSPPDNTTLIVFDYQSALHLVLTSAPDSGTDIVISMESGPSTKTFPTNNVEVYTWSLDAAGEFVGPSDSLKDNLKGFLDLRRVLGTSVEVLDGFNIELSYHMNVDFAASVNSVVTSAAIVQAIEAYFTSVVNVNAGALVPLAAIYDSVFPLTGVEDVVIQDVRVRVPIGTGNALTAVFRPNSTTPGRFIASERLPLETGNHNIKVFVDTLEAGESNGSTITAGEVLVASGTGPYSVLGGSYVNSATGDFLVKISPPPARGAVVYLDFYLDELLAANGMQIWNVQADAWEMATLGDIFINGSKVN